MRSLCDASSCLCRVCAFSQARGETFGRVYDNDVERNVALAQSFFTGQTEITQNRVEGVNHAAEGGLADTIGLCDVDIGAIFAS